jgi:choice-of-anchor C domain-containing protein
VKRRSTVSASIAVLASLVLAGSALAAFAGATNGSFETGSSDPGSSVQLNAVSTAITGWTITTGSVDWIGTYWTAQSGARSLDLSGGGAGAISQTLATKIGKNYDVSFYLAGNPVAAPAVKTLTVSVTGGALVTYTFDTTGRSVGSMGWTAKSYSFVATSTSTVLTFTSLTNTNAGPALDNVVVTEMAAAGTRGGPGAACKAGGWKTAVDKAGNHFRNQGDCVSYHASKGKNLGSVKH